MICIRNSSFSASDLAKTPECQPHKLPFDSSSGRKPVSKRQAAQSMPLFALMLVEG
jgi:hypothetical protein